MFSNKKITISTKNYLDNIHQFKTLLYETDTIIIGAGAGLSAAAGFIYAGSRFEDNFADFIEKYDLHDMYSGGFYPFASPEEYWAYWSRYIALNRYTDTENGTYKKLYELVKDKDYFVLTTNVDHQFQKTGFDKSRLFYTQGDFGLFQCSEPCHNATYDNDETIQKMVQMQKDMRIPTDLIPHCPICHKPMTVNLRSDDTFVQDDGWYHASRRYSNFLNLHQSQKVLFLELGVGMNTPGIIKYPFWQMTYQWDNAAYVCINYGHTYAPQEIQNKSICIDGDIQEVLAIAKLL